jgi:hypothetical protein
VRPSHGRAAIALDEFVARIEETPVPSFRAITPDHIAIKCARERTAKRGLRVIGPRKEVERFYADEAERETGLLAEFEAVLAKARPPGRPNKILRDLIIMMYVTVELPDRDTGPSSRSYNQAFKNVAHRIGPGLSAGLIKHAYHRSRARLLAIERQSGNEVGAYALLVTEQLLSALCLHLAGKTGCDRPAHGDAEACIGHVRKTVSLMEVLRLQAQTPLPSAGCFLPSA